MNFVLILALVAAANPADQFDLLCTGTQRIVPGAQSEVSREFRFDLNEKKWCENECKVTHDILKIEPTYFELEHRDTDPIGGPGRIRHEIQRDTGKWVVFLDSFGMVLSINGMCSKADFKGFPAPVQKF